MPRAVATLAWPSVAGSLLLIAALASCRATSGEPRMHEAIVVGVDYAFEAPETMAAGPTALAFDNRGNVPHEMILVLLKPGMTLRDVLEGLQSGASPEEFVDGGANILIAGPGESSSGRILIDLESGREYALVCNFRDAPDAPPHTELGMFKGIRVE